MGVMQIGGDFLVHLHFLWWVRWVGGFGSWMVGSLEHRLGGILAIMGCSLLSRDSWRASMSILYSRYISIGRIEASISIAIMGVVLKAPVIRHRHVFCRHLRLLSIWLFQDHQNRGRPYSVMGRMAL